MALVNGPRPAFPPWEKRAATLLVTSPTTVVVSNVVQIAFAVTCLSLSRASTTVEYAVVSVAPTIVVVMCVSKGRAMASAKVGYTSRFATLHEPKPSTVGILEKSWVEQAHSVRTQHMVTAIISIPRTLCKQIAPPICTMRRTNGQMVSAYVV